MAFCASSSDTISTNAKPLARPVAWSRITRTLSTAPARLKSDVNSSSVTLYGRLPTYNLRPIAARPFSRAGLCLTEPRRRASDVTPGLRSQLSAFGDTYGHRNALQGGRVTREYIAEMLPKRSDGGGINGRAELRVT